MTTRKEKQTITLNLSSTEEARIVAARQIGLTAARLDGTPIVDATAKPELDRDMLPPAARRLKRLSCPHSALLPRFAPSLLNPHQYRHKEERKREQSKSKYLVVVV